MPHTEGFYIENDVHEILKLSCKKRGDKSKIINEALKKYDIKVVMEDLFNIYQGLIINK